MTGETISHYRITDELGRGGMGIVYRAEDTKLDRTVALKLLPASALTSADDQARFYREARAAASLSHPNIAHVYEIDEAVAAGESRPFIAMEYVDGESLAERIGRGPLPLRDVTSIGTQIASGLAAAHAKNIVHRDIKPGNVMLTKAGEAKILDFGLAKTAASTKLTRMGSTLGTFAYMSPEQARGEEVDARTDVWSLGVVLYEMITGRVPFPGEYEQAVVYGILNEDPEPPTGLRTGVPMELERIVSKCLAKDSNMRYPSVEGLIVDLRRLERNDSGHGRAATLLTKESVLSEVPQSVGRRETVEQRSVKKRTTAGSRAWLLMAFVAGFGLAGLASRIIQSPPVPPFRKLTLHFEGLSWIQQPVMSPNGRYIALVGADSMGTRGIYLHDLSEGTTRRVDDTFDKGYPMFSPDGSRLAIQTYPEEGIHVVAIPDGLPVQAVDRGHSMIWESNHSLVFEWEGDTYRKNLTDGREELVARLDTLPGREQFIYTGDILRDRAVLLASRAHDYAVGENADLIAVDLTNGEWSVLEPAAVNGWYVKGGFLLYQLGTDDGRVVVRPFDTDELRFTGPPQNLFDETSWTRVRPTPAGDLLYVPDAPLQPRSRLEWLLPDGRREIAIDPTDNVWVLPALSPDGRFALVTERRSVWQWPLVRVDLRTGVRTAVSSGGFNFGPSWTPGGETYFYSVGLWRHRSIVKQTGADLSSAEEIISGADTPSVSDDGEWLLFSAIDDVGGRDLYAFNLISGDTVAVETGPEEGRYPTLSPDGRYVVYSVRQAGASDLRVRPFPEGSGITVATGADNRAFWAVDGSALLYVKNGNVVRLPVDTTGEFRVRGSEERLTEDGLVRDFCVDTRSGRLLLLTSLQPARRQYATLEWWQGWSQELKRKTAR